MLYTVKASEKDKEFTTQHGVFYVYFVRVEDPDGMILDVELNQKPETAPPSVGQQIDGNAEGLVGGPTNREFMGFHRIERDLWVRRDLVAAASDTKQLQSLVARLSRQKLSAELPATMRQGVAEL